jgi:hypothetical protein
MLSPLPGPLFLEPAGDGLPLIAPVATEFQAGHPAGASLLSNPRLRNREPFGDLLGGEEGAQSRLQPSGW